MPWSHGLLLATIILLQMKLTLYTASQNPHLDRLIMSAFNAVHAEHKFRIVAPDVGGGFGSKINVYAEDVVVSYASKKIGRPVKWVAERSESFMSDNHGRDHVTHAELALNSDSKIIGIKSRHNCKFRSLFFSSSCCYPTHIYMLLCS